LRSKFSLNYEDKDILDFISSALKVFDILESSYGIYHGLISPQSFYLIGGSNPNEPKAASYAILDTAMFYWYDYKK
jgi:hypothetical protein